MLLSTGARNLSNKLRFFTAVFEKKVGWGGFTASLLVGAQFGHDQHRVTDIEIDPKDIT